MESSSRRYVRLVAAALIMICMGIIYMWSVFSGYIIAGYGWSPADSGLTASVMIACFSIGSLIGGRIQDRIGPRWVTLLGIVMFAAGVFLSSYTAPIGPVPLYLTFGVIGGFGVGFAYSSVLASTNKWFPDKLNMASSVTVTCFGLATVVFSPIVSKVIGSLGVVSGFRVVAVIFFVICLIGWTQIKNPPEGWTPDGYEKKQVDFTKQRQMALSETIKTPQMWIMFLSIWFITVTFFGINPILKQLAAGHGLDPALSTGVVMVTGLGMAFGRLFFPVIVGKIGRRNTAVLLGVIVLVCSIAMIFAQGLFFLVLAFLMAAGAGAPGAVWPTWSAENFGLKNNGANFGFILLGIGISSLVSMRFATMVSKSFFGGADIAYFLMGAIMALIAIILLVLFKPVKQDDMD